MPHDDRSLSLWRKFIGYSIVRSHLFRFATIRARREWQLRRIANTEGVRDEEDWREVDADAYTDEKMVEEDRRRSERGCRRREKRAGRSIRRYRDHRTVAPRSLHLNANGPPSPCRAELDCFGTLDRVFSQKIRNSQRNPSTPPSLFSLSLFSSPTAQPRRTSSTRR